MSLSGERLIIAAMPDVVSVGQEFSEVPPHMPVVPSFELQENRRGRLTDTMGRLLLGNPVLAKARGGLKMNIGDDENVVPARRIAGIDLTAVKDGVKVLPEQFALRFLVESLGHMEDEVEFADKFKLYMADTDDFTLGYRQRPRFKSIALIGSETDDYHVIANYPLGSHK